MPNLRAHCAISRKRTGRSFEELHRWIDQYREELGAEHRSKRHHWSRSTMREIKTWWERKGKGLGNLAVEEWLFHIALDNLYTMYKFHKRNNPMSEQKNFFAFGFMDNGYIQYLGNILGEKGMAGFFEGLEEILTVELTELENDIEEMFD